MTPPPLATVREALEYMAGLDHDLAHTKAVAALTVLDAHKDCVKQITHAFAVRKAEEARAALDALQREPTDAEVEAAMDELVSEAAYADSATRPEMEEIDKNIQAAKNVIRRKVAALAQEQERHRDDRDWLSSTGVVS